MWQINKCQMSKCPNVRCFYAKKVSCNTNKATQSKTKKLTYSSTAMKFCDSMRRATPAVATQTFFRLRINTFLRPVYTGDFLSRQLNAIFVAAKLHQVSNPFETPAISRRQIALKIAPSLHVRFWSCNFSATKIASICRDKKSPCVNGPLVEKILLLFYQKTWEPP